MTRRMTSLAHAFVVAAVFSMQSAPADDDALKKDLTAVIALQGLPCGQVTAVTVQAADDYAVTCTDDHRYRVYLNAAGRVIVEARK